MDYRRFPKTGEMISLLGFGTMRLPVQGKDESRIDEAEAIKLIRHAIDNGVNYMDTAYMYHAGNSEVVLGKALKDGYREKVFLADKFPAWLMKREGGAEAIFENQFKRLDVDYIDFYLVHSLSKLAWKKIQEKEILPYLERMKAQGRIGKIGFSFHDDLDLFKTIVDAYPWEFCQIQFNYLDSNFQAGLEGLRYAAKKGLPVIIMEPLKGGRLAQTPPDSVKEIWDKAPVKRSPVEWAFRYVTDFPEVLTVLSGMSSMEELEENLKIFDNAKPGSLTEEEHKLINEAAVEYSRTIKAACTKCRYCMPCPQDVSIPTVIDYYNQWHLYHTYRSLKRDYNLDMPEKNRASRCIACKICEEKCPQHLPISDIIKEAAEIYE